MAAVVVSHNDDEASTTSARIEKYDIIGTRGGCANLHHGNQVYRWVVRSLQGIFRREVTTLAEKKKLTMAVIQTLQEEFGTRFLEVTHYDRDGMKLTKIPRRRDRCRRSFSPDSIVTMVEVMPVERSIAKVKQCFREKHKPAKLARCQKTQKQDDRIVEEDARTVYLAILKKLYPSRYNDEMVARGRAEPSSPACSSNDKNRETTSKKKKSQRPPPRATKTSQTRTCKSKVTAVLGLKQKNQDNDKHNDTEFLQEEGTLGRRMMNMEAEEASPRAGRPPRQGGYGKSNEEVHRALTRSSSCSSLFHQHRRASSTSTCASPPAVENERGTKQSKEESQHYAATGTSRNTDKQGAPPSFESLPFFSASPHLMSGEDETLSISSTISPCCKKQDHGATTWRYFESSKASNSTDKPADFLGMDDDDRGYFCDFKGDYSDHLVLPVIELNVEDEDFDQDDSDNEIMSFARENDIVLKSAKAGQQDHHDHEQHPKENNGVTMLEKFPWFDQEHLVPASASVDEGIPPRTTTPHGSDVQHGGWAGAGYSTRNKSLSWTEVSPWEPPFFRK